MYAAMVVITHKTQYIIMGIGCSRVATTKATRLYTILPRNMGVDRANAAFSTSKRVEFANRIRVKPRHRPNLVNRKKTKNSTESWLSKPYTMISMAPRVAIVEERTYVLRRPSFSKKTPLRL